MRNQFPRGPVVPLPGEGLTEVECLLWCPCKSLTLPRGRQVLTLSPLQVTKWWLFWARACHPHPRAGVLGRGGVIPWWDPVGVAPRGLVGQSWAVAAQGGGANGGKWSLGRI